MIYRNALVATPASLEQVMEALERIRQIIDRREHLTLMVPFDLNKVNEAMLRVYLSSADSLVGPGNSLRRLRRLFQLLNHADQADYGGRRLNWQVRLGRLVSTILHTRKLFFRKKTVLPSRWRRQGGSSFFSAAKSDLRNAP